jgi:WS/DGAT/MGAT family acyltransferase
MHQAAVGVLDGRPLLDAADHVQIPQIRALLEPKVLRTPELVQVLHPTGLFQGRPLWVDDARFRIEHHVGVVSLPAPGGEREALKFVERTLAEQMDRSRPLWQLWFLEGYAPDRVGIVLKTHHALVDGPAMVNLVGRLFDVEPSRRSEAPVRWNPSAPPSRRALVADNFKVATGDIGHAAGRLRHPLRLARAGGATLLGGWETVRRGRGAPVTSLNQPIGVARQVAVYPLSLREVKRVAHGSHVKVNDVFLNLVAGGLGAVLLSRGEPVGGVTLHASIAVSMHRAADPTMVGNHVGTMIVPLPVGEENPAARLAAIAAGTSMAKARQRPVVTSAFMSLLTRSGLTRRYIRRQQMINVLTTNLHGPQVDLYVGGARLLEVFAAPPIAGNVTVSFAALSYGQQFNISVVTDTASWPDLDVLMAGVDACWHESSRPSMVPFAAGL